MFSKKSLLLVALMAAMSLVLAACGGGEPETIVVTQIVTETITETVIEEVEGETVEVEVTREVETIVEVEVEVEPEAEAEGEAGGELADVYTIGIFEDPITLNSWSYRGPDNSVWTAYVMGGDAGTLYTLSDQRFDFVPSLAADLPPEPVEQDDGTFTITVDMVEDAVWSDGEPITADDVVFTVNTALNLDLGGGWASIFRKGLLLGAEATGEFQVTFIWSEVPGLAVWQFGTAQGPILPEHFWGPIVADASSFIDGLEAPENCGEDASEEELAVCEAYENARQTLYSADPTGVPWAGQFATDQLEPGAFVARTANENSHLNNVTVTEYSDGTYMETDANGNSSMYYGEGGGDVTLEYTTGPYVNNVVFTIYGSQDAAFLAMIDGEVDYVLNPLSVAQGLRQQAESTGEITTLTNADNGLFYLAFNMRKAPFDDPAFREAVDIVLDKEFVASNILQSSVIPAYAIVPGGNAFWSYNDQIDKPFIGMSREDRVNMAVQVLSDAGYTWDVPPAWNADTVDVDPGEGMRMPNGEPVPEITILGPGPSYDPQRASFNQWISEWMRELGMPAESELTGFNTILDPVFVEASFDMYILGWGLSIYPDYLCDFFDSRNDTASTGNYNTPGHNDADFDALCDEFLAETNIVEAQAQAFELQDILATNRPYLPLFYRQSIDLVRRNVEFPYTESLGGIADLNGFQGSVKVTNQ